MGARVWRHALRAKSRDLKFEIGDLRESKRGGVWTIWVLEVDATAKRRRACLPRGRPTHPPYEGTCWRHRGVGPTSVLGVDDSANPSAGILRTRRGGPLFDRCLSTSATHPSRKRLLSGGTLRTKRSFMR